MRSNIRYKTCRYYLTDKFTEEFKEILGKIINNTTVTKIDLAGSDLRYDGAQALAKALEVNNTLKQLDLHYNDIRPAGAKAFAEALRDNVTLTELDLSLNSIGEGVQALAEVLKDNGTLIKLDLSDNYIQDSGAENLMGGLLDNYKLQILYLENNSIKLVGAKAIADTLTDNKTIEILNLAYNEIGDDGVKALAGALGNNKSLKELYLYNNKIGDEGAEALAGALRDNKTLKNLDICKNNIGDVGAKALANELSENFTILKLEMPYSADENSKTLIKTYLERNNKIDQIATEIFDYYTQDPTTSPFPLLDDNLIKDPKICLKIFEKSLSKIIDSKKANDQEVNEGKINQEFIEHLKSSRGGMRLLLSCKEQSNSFGLTLEDHFWVTGVMKDKGGKGENEKNETADLSKNPDLFTKMQQILSPLVKGYFTEAPSPNPSLTKAKGGVKFGLKITKKVVSKFVPLKPKPGNSL